MSVGPDKTAFVYDLIGSTASITATAAYTAVDLPVGKKAIQVNVPAVTAITVKVQNSLDGVTWFDISSSTSGQSWLAEVDSVVKKWRVNVTAVGTAGSATALIAQCLI